MNPFNSFIDCKTIGSEDMTLARVASPGDSVTSHCKVIVTKSRENLMNAVLVLSIYCMCFCSALAL